MNTAVHVKLFLKQTFVIDHHEVTVDLLHEVERHTDGDQEAGAAVEARQIVVDVHRIRHDVRQDRHDCQEARPHIRDVKHDLFKVVLRTLARTMTANDRIVPLQVLCHVFRIERNGRPEIAEEVDQHDVEEIVRKHAVMREPAGRGTKPLTKPHRVRIAAERLRKHTEEPRRDHEQGAGENDRHDARLIHFDRQVLTHTAHDAAAADVLRTLGRNTALTKRDEHNARHDGEEQERQHEQVHETGITAADLQTAQTAAAVEVRVQLDDRFRHTGKDACHDEEADPVTDTVSIDLFAKPHEERRSARHDEDRNDLPGKIKRTGPRITETVQEDLVASENGRHGDQVEPALENAEHDRRIARVLIDLFTSALPFLLKFLQRSVNTRQKLENDRSGNVRHDPQTKDRDLTNIRRTENRSLIQQGLKSITRSGVFDRDFRRIDHRKIDLVANTKDRQEQKSQEDLATQLRDGKDDSNLFKHE